MPPLLMQLWLADDLTLDEACALKVYKGPLEHFHKAQKDIKKQQMEMNHQMMEMMKSMMEKDREERGKREIEERERHEEDRREREKDRTGRAKLMDVLLERELLPPDISVLCLAELPPINIPTFSGDKEEWPTFWGLFNDLVHSQPSYPKSMKFHHLRTCLSGDAR
ncbi:MAG: DUF1759 domain-containing protein, partial [Gammaproteobacteria bacterium]|nr:DUF1759 domain-containing protein [Gammaproteobacteria bacterium]